MVVLKDLIISIISEILNSPVNDFTKISETKSWDSLKTMQIIMALDEEGIFIPLEKFASIESVQDLINLANKN
jgi:acyl carrier protein